MRIVARNYIPQVRYISNTIKTDVLPDTKPNTNAY